MLFISFSCLTVLNRSGESWYACFIPGHRGKAFSLLPLNLMLAVAVHIWPLLCWGGLLLFLSSVILSCFFSLTLLRWLTDFVLHSVNDYVFIYSIYIIQYYIEYIIYNVCICMYMYVCITWCLSVEPSDSHLVMEYNPFSVLFNPVC